MSSNFISATISKRLFMLLDRNLPIQVRYEFKLDKPVWELSHMQIIPGPIPGVIPIFRLRKTNYEYIRFPNLLSAARYVKALKQKAAITK